VSRNRPRGLFRAAALLAVGVSPLLVGAASAAGTAPSLDGVEGKLGNAPKLDASIVDQAGKIASGQTLKLPAPAPDLQAPAAPKAPEVKAPAAPAVPAERALKAPSGLPAQANLPVGKLPVGEFPAVPDVADLPIAVPNLGGLPVALPSVG